MRLAPSAALGRSLKARLVLFFDAHYGNVAIIFALVLLPTVGMVGLGIDISRSLSARTALQAATDAGVLAAATEAEAIMQAGGNFATAQYAGVAAGQQVYYSNTTKVGRWLGAVPSPNIQVNPGAAVITATGNFTSPVPTVLGKLFGTSTFTVAGHASSSLNVPKYLNISVVTDISQSMGLAATSSGQTQLGQLTGGCQFGCHVYQSGQTGTTPYEAQAHNAIRRSNYAST